tara:strand:+ start:546 stop:803 length:258 start_codon:yes stop_codon:yes gene_type:complete
MSDELLKAQINALIRDEIQEGINEVIEEKGEGFGKGEELTVNIPNDEVDKLIKEYKKIKKRQKSNFGQIKKLGLVDKHGRELKKD